MAWLAMHASGPYERQPKVTEFLPGWARRDLPDPDDGEDDDEDDDGG